MFSAFLSSVVSVAIILRSVERFCLAYLMVSYRSQPLFAGSFHRDIPYTGCPQVSIGINGRYNNRLCRTDVCYVSSAPGIVFSAAVGLSKSTVTCQSDGGFGKFRFLALCDSFLKFMSSINSWLFFSPMSHRNCFLPQLHFHPLLLSSMLS